MAISLMRTFTRTPCWRHGANLHNLPGVLAFQPQCTRYSRSLQQFSIPRNPNPKARGLRATSTELQEQSCNDETAPTILLVDGHNLAFRAYHAHQTSKHGPLLTSTGVPTSVTHTFLATLLAVMEAWKPQGVAVVFDSGRSFRKDVYEQYKANRVPPEEDFRTDLANLQGILAAMGLPMPTAVGYEADDVIGTLAQHSAQQGCKVLVFSNDKDLRQLVQPDGGIRVLQPQSGAPGSSRKSDLPAVLDAAEIFSKMGVHPHQVADYLALTGDSADNFPGVKGIGPKTATELLQQFGSVAALLQRLEEVQKPRHRKLLEEGMEDLRVSLELAGLRLDAPLEGDLLRPRGLLFRGMDRQEVARLLQQLELELTLKSLPRWEKLLGVVAGTGGDAAAADGIDAGGAGSGSSSSAAAAGDASAGQQATAGGTEQEGGLPIGAGGSSQAPSASPAIAAKKTAADVEDLLGPVEEVLSHVQQLDEALRGWVGSHGVAWEQLVSQFPAAQLEGELPDSFDPALVVSLQVPPAWTFEFEAAANVKPGGVAGVLRVSCSMAAGLPSPPSPSPSPTTLEVCLPLQSVQLQKKKAPAMGTVQLEGPHREAVQKLKLLLEDPAVPKTMHDAKAAAHMLRRALGVELQGVGFDTMLAGYVQQPDRKCGINDLQGACAAAKLLEVPPAGLRGSEQVRAVGQALLQDLLTLPAKIRILLALELPLQWVLLDMETEGILLDADVVSDLNQETTEQLRALEEKVKECCREQGAPEALGATLTNTQSVSQLLFKVLKLDTTGVKKTKTGWSTDQNTLDGLKGQHPVVEMVIQHRKLTRLKTGYLDSLPGHISTLTGRIHTTYNQAVAATGRLSSTDPNMQNIPVKGELGLRLREAFVARPGWKLVSADYSQIELRILAAFSGEPGLVDAFNQELDVHSVAARVIYGKSEVSPDERRVGKTANFAVIYGSGPKNLAEELGIPLKQAQTIIAKYQHSYPGIFEYLETQQKMAVAHGYSETMYGRRRYFTFQTGPLRGQLGKSLEAVDSKAIRSPGRADAHTLRAAANAPLQGTAADIIKMAMLAVHGELRRQGLQSKLLLQVHDELVVEAAALEVEAVKQLLRRCMQEVALLKVPLSVSIGCGTSWEK